ncbi:MAG: YbaB/EbfC family nucleoid-associated protein [candidate division WOR-3 bacterium]|nr:YbaB/EbfC family nucleoid-associated protein [candidate division WOR-3 bacterium]MCX7756903.1 YbaB/EbfC family nucleoid-associated protein [candidate division WOR-3 bacterium]MDW7987854.1 YbaB/EbfC family nucleoid-associated protein [candidate division WOR-3 bacterium]
MKFDLFKLAQDFNKIQTELKQLQENIRAEGSAGGGIVKAVADGTGTIVSLEISSEFFASHDIDREMLQDLIVAAVNSALSQAKVELQKELQKLIGFPLTGLLPPNLT